MGVLLKLEFAFVAQIDAARGDVPRTVWIKRAIERALAPEPVAQRSLGPVPPKHPVVVGIEQAAQLEAAKFQFGPAKTKPGSRLKVKK